MTAMDPQDGLETARRPGRKKPPHGPTPVHERSVLVGFFDGRQAAEKPVCHSDFLAKK